MRPKRFARIGDILPAVLKSAGLEQKLRDQEILTIWPAVVGEEIAARTQCLAPGALLYGEGHLEETKGTGASN
jgi:hypothetical protein